MSKQLTAFSMMSMVVVTGVLLAACQPRESDTVPLDETEIEAQMNQGQPSPTVAPDPEIDSAMMKLDGSLEGSSQQDFAATGLSETELSQ